jgi:integrase
MLRVEPSGKKIFYFDYHTKNSKRSSHKLGNAELFTVAEAREKAKKFLARVALGEIEEKKNTFTLGDYLEEHYFPWVLANRKNGAGTIRRIKLNFYFLWETRIENILPVEIERWRVGKIKIAKAATINKDLTALKASINWGFKRGLFDTHPLARLERLQERDSRTIVRYLTDEERTRLMTALDTREERIRLGRDSHNKWLAEREKKLMPDAADHIKPMVIISLNTGIRRGALFGLVWSDVDFERRMLTLRSEESKPGKENHVPLNDAAFKAFSEWRQKTTGGDLIFPSPRTGRCMDNCANAWEKLMRDAKIEKFRWHDMRHDFASQLVMKGVDLNTVRELLGHSDLKMTLRYAHLAPEVKVKAVGVLD